MNELTKLLDGKKTYIVSVGLIVYAILGLLLQQMPQDQAIMLILQGLGFGALRSGVSKLNNSDN